MKSRLVIAVFGLLAFFIVLNRGIWQQEAVITWDATGYYMYLPALIIHHDPGQLSFYKEIDSLYQPSGSALQYGIHSHPATGRQSTRYPAGVALFELPGFLVTHCFTQVFSRYPADGYSAPYQLAVAISTILWAVAGLLLLRRALLRRYPEPVVWKVLLLIAAGTNFYYYTAFLQGWSHAYSFFLFAAVLYLTERWYRMGSAKPLLLLGLVLGLVTITRPTNVLIAAIPLLWPAGGGTGKAAFLRRQLVPLLASLLLFVCILFIQLAYWKYVTGQWVYYSYTDEGFDFLHPNIWKGLFSYRKGWFIYTPMALVFCFGLAPLYRSDRDLFLPVAAYIFLQIYIVFSWKIWHYGGGFSCRPMVESLAVLALPAGALVQRFSAAKRKALRVAAAVVAGLFVVLNLFQTYQYSLRIILFDGMTQTYYWRVFGRLKIDAAERKLLQPASGRTTPAPPAPAAPPPSSAY